MTFKLQLLLLRNRRGRRRGRGGGRGRAEEEQKQEQFIQKITTKREEQEQHKEPQLTSFLYIMSLSVCTVSHVKIVSRVQLCIIGQKK